MQVNASDTHVVRFPCFVEDCVFVFKSGCLFFGIGVDPLVGGIGGELDFVFGFSKFLPGHGLLVRGDRGCGYILVDFLLNLCSGFESISFQFDEHFLFHESAVFVGHLIVSSFEDDVIVSQFLQISI